MSELQKKLLNEKLSEINLDLFDLNMLNSNNDSDYYNSVPTPLYKNDSVPAETKMLTSESSHEMAISFI